MLDDDSMSNDDDDDGLDVKYFSIFSFLSLFLFLNRFPIIQNILYRFN
jgi:hypothetical protein